MNSSPKSNPETQDETPRPVRHILHADLDAFYASVEQLDNPELRGKPILVGGRPETGALSLPPPMKRESSACTRPCP